MQEKKVITIEIENKGENSEVTVVPGRCTLREMQLGLFGIIDAVAQARGLTRKEAIGALVMASEMMEGEHE